MNLATTADLFFVIAVLVPGFIYNAVLVSFVPLRQSQQRELILLRLLTLTAISYAVSSPLIFSLLFLKLFLKHEVVQAFIWFVIIFLVPICVGLVHAKIVQTGALKTIYRWLGLRPINPVPTGWDWIFSRTEPCFVVVLLLDGTEIAGYFGPQSMASSDPERRDIYVEKVYHIPEAGGTWTEVDRSLGMYVPGDQIATIEFKTEQEHAKI